VVEAPLVRMGEDDAELHAVSSRLEAETRFVHSGGQDPRVASRL
jgi:hypothetical protein